MMLMNENVGDVDEWKQQRAKIVEIKITGRNSGLLQGSTAENQNFGFQSEITGFYGKL